ncbi:MAG: hypothetical protein WA705_20790 [Candidatus Ozemobacteraceae bacterium]
MTDSQESLKEPDIQLFSKRFDQLIRHKNHIIDILQEEVEKASKAVAGNVAAQDVVRLEQENAALKARLETHTQDASSHQLLSALRAELETLQRENAELKTRPSAEQTEVLNAAILRWKTEAEALRENRIDRETIRPELDELARLRRERVEIESLRIENARLKSSSEDLAVRLREQEIAAAGLAEIPRLTADLLAAHKEADDLRFRLKEAENDVSLIPVLREQIETDASRSSSELSVATHDVELLRLQLDEACKAQKHSETSERNVREALDAQTAELSARTAELGIRTTEFRELSQHLQSLRSEERAAVEENEMLRHDIRRLQSIITEKNSALERMQQEQDAIIAVHDHIMNQDERAKIYELRILELQGNLETATIRENGLRDELGRYKAMSELLQARLSKVFFDRLPAIPYPVAEQIEAPSPEEETLPVESMTFKLPFLFPERLPRPMAVIAKKTIPAWRSAPIAEGHPAFRVTRPIRFFRVFQQPVMPAVKLLSNRAERIELPPMQAPRSITEKASMPVPTVPMPAHQPFQAALPPDACMKPHMPLPSLQERLFLPRKKLVRRSDAFFMFLDFLVSTWSEHMRFYFKRIPHSPRAQEAKSLFQQSPAQFPSRFSPWHGILLSRNLAPVPHIQIARSSLAPALPRGRLSMLMKGIEESLSALNSRLENAPSHTKPHSTS